MKNVIMSILLLSFLLSIPVLSEAGKCENLLSKVESYPVNRLYELVEKAPESCKMAIKEKILKERGAIIDDFKKR